ncbi:MAG: glycosyltransferase family 4 protein [Caulobacterales bacterium]|nr:glycosyltransferase family 4 protein [Caulobacterales bacterium]
MSRSVLYISQAAPLPARRRTWQQARALAQQGWKVRVLCPRRRGACETECQDGIRIVRFAQPFEGRGRAGILIEYAFAALVIGWALSRELLKERVDVLHVVNPPDWIALAALLLRPLGAKLVFDLADLTPRLYQAKFARRDIAYRALCAINRAVLRRADLVITSNDDYRRIAIRLGRRRWRSKPTIAIHSYPEFVANRPSPRSPGPLRIGYLGILGAQDGVASLLQAVSILRAKTDLPEFELQVVGDGPEAASLRELSRGLGLQNCVKFLGFLEGEARDRTVAAFDIAVACDPLNRFTRRISLNKIFAYSGLGLPIVATPLPGTRRLMGDAAQYTSNDTAQALADELEAMLRSDVRRLAFAQKARDRASRQFSWAKEAEAYVAAVENLADPLTRPAPRSPAPPDSHPGPGTSVPAPPSTG